MRKPIFIFLLSTCFIGFPLASIAQCQEISKYKVVNTWFRYFKNLRSVQLEWKYTVTTHPVKEAVGQTWANKFALNGAKFRYETTLPETVKDVNVNITAYDGQLYQTLDGGNGDTRLVHRKEPNSDIVYGGWLPLFSIYQFAFDENSFYTLETLQQRETWQKVLSRVVSIERATRHGRQGLWIKIKGKARSEIYDVQLNEASFQPLYSRRTYQVSQGGKKNVTEVNSSEVTKTMPWIRGEQKSEFPLRVEGQSTQNGKLYIADTNDIDPKSVKLNKPIHRRLFTISRSQAELFIDQTTTKEPGKAEPNSTAKN